VSDDPRLDDGRLSAPTTKARRLQRACLDVLHGMMADGEQSTNARFVFYELEPTGIVRKPKQGESRRLRGFPAGPQDLGDALFAVRERGIVEWGFIEDETRTLIEWSYAPSVGIYLRDRLEEATINPWHPEPPPLLLCESRSLSGPLTRHARDYCCPIAPTNGQAGGFLRTDVGPLLAREPRPVLYLGDLDHQGDQIEANTRRVLERDILGFPLDWRRILLTQEQVEEHGLDPMWKLDERYKPARAGWAWEAEALGQARVGRILRAELDALLPEPLEDVLEREGRQRDQWRERLA
jgi:hypothetical protein